MDWVIGTKIHCCEWRFFFEKAVLHPFCELMELRLCVETAANTGLVCYDDEEGLTLNCSATEIKYPIDKFEIFDVVNVVFFNIDHPVPIKEEGAACFVIGRRL